MIGVRIDGMVMIMIMVVAVIVTVVIAMVVMMVMVVVLRLQSAKAGAEAVAKLAICDVRSRGRGALTFDVVVMAFLNSANLGLKTQNLGSVLAHGAVGRRDLTDLFGDPFGKGAKNIVMIVEIARRDEIDVRVRGGDLIGKAIDAVDQNAREEEVGEDDDALVAKLGGVVQAGFDKRECNARIANFAPAKSHAFLKHARDFGDVAVGVRIRGAAPDDDKAGFVQGDRAGFCIGLFDGFGNSCTRGGNHLGVDAKFTPVGNFDAVFGGIGVQNRGDVIFRMHGRKKHAGNRKDPVAAFFAQRIKAVTDHRVGELKIAVFHFPVGRQIARQLLGKH